MIGAHLKPPLPELEARSDWLRAPPVGSGHDHLHPQHRAPHGLKPGPAYEDDLGYLQIGHAQCLLDTLPATCGEENDEASAAD
jgi:hypothetical protein